MKKILSFTLCIVTAFTLAFSLSSCHTHHYVGGVAFNATCGREGYEEYTCSICGAKKFKRIPVTGEHDYVMTHISPTCGAIGYDAYTCSVCGNYYDEEYLPEEHRIVNGVCTVCGGVTEGTEGLQFLYQEKPVESYVVTAYTGEDEEVVVPILYNDLPVRTIGKNAFMGNTKIKKVFLPVTVKLVDEGAFAFCSSLEQVNGNMGLNHIATNAFQYCTSLVSVHFEYKVLTNISEFAFLGCVSLKEAIVPDSVTYFGDGAFEDCTSLKVARTPIACKYIFMRTFMNCTALEKLTIGERTRYIDPLAFANCTALREVALPKGLINIRQYAFLNCTALERATVETNTKYISRFVFEGCTSLQRVRFMRTENWYASTDMDLLGEPLLVNDEKKNAEMLTNGYRNYFLRNSIEES